MVQTESKIILKKEALFLSLNLISKNPKIVLPKMLVAFLYGAMTLISVYLLSQVFNLISVEDEAILLVQMPSLLASVFVFFILSVIIYFLDLFVSAMYPLLVSDALEGKSSLVSAIKGLKERAFSIFAAGFVIFFLLILISVFQAALMSIFGSNEVAVIASFILSFLMVFALYFLFPILISGKKEVSISFSASLDSSIKNKYIVIIFSIIPFSITILKFILAFYANSPEAAFIFWGLVVLTGIVYTIHATVNQVIYLNLTNSKFLFSESKSVKQLMKKSKKK